MTGTRNKKSILGALVLIAAGLPCLGVRAEVEVDWGAFVEDDMRLAVDRVDEPGIARNTTTLGGDLKVVLVPERIKLVGDLKVVWTGFSQDTTFQGLTTRSEVAPFYLESNAAYIELQALLPRLDVRIGRQIVNWGAADMFNPTNNLNALDLEDPIMFGDRVANQMIRFDYGLDDNFVLTAVWVPVFQPALLPASGLLAIGDPSSEFPFIDPKLRLEAERLRNHWRSSPDDWVIDQPDVTAHMPGFALKNSQVAVRLGWTMGVFDASLSYYLGFDTLPAPSASSSDIDTVNVSKEKTPAGLPKKTIATEVQLVYPRKQVLGFDLTGQVPFLDDMGIWFEGAFVFPQAVRMDFDITRVVTSARVLQGDTVSSKPYFKCTAGADYSINKHFFILAQYMRGFVDEMGAQKQNHYWMAGVDSKWIQDKLLLRLFVLGELPHEDDDITLMEEKEGSDGVTRRFVKSTAIGATNDGTIASYAIFPQISVKPWDGVDVSAGGYFPLGHRESKFAQAAVGPTLVFLRAKASF
ncbi:MAG: hypothetical protein MUC50_10850 [Myxococcota bacterium]|nr:hypothetical protein [Myxococcota bacterium]